MIAFWLHIKINNAIDLKQFKFNEQMRIKLRKELGLENCFVIGHVGRFMQQKNHCFLIDIFNELLQHKQDARLLLIGDGPLKSTVEEKVKKLELTEKVIFLGVRTDVACLYNAMDVFVLPSLYEGLPVVGVEVQANGLPFLCSDKVTKEILISQNISLYSLNKTAFDWSNKIMEIACLERICELLNSNFDINVESKKMENNYNLLNKKCKRG